MTKPLVGEYLLYTQQSVTVFRIHQFMRRNHLLPDVVVDIYEI